MFDPRRGLRKVLKPPMTSVAMDDIDPERSRSTTMWVPAGRAWLLLSDMCSFRLPGSVQAFSDEKTLNQGCVIGGSGKSVGTGSAGSVLVTCRVGTASADDRGSKFIIGTSAAPVGLSTAS